MQKKLMTGQKIVECLRRLGDGLQDLGIQQPIRILMIGGAFMITQIGNRTVTEDVDVLVYIDRNFDDYQKLLIVSSPFSDVQNNDLETGRAIATKVF